MPPVLIPVSVFKRLLERDEKDSLSHRMTEINRKSASARGVEVNKLTAG
jgi:hypothetical protein